MEYRINKFDIEKLGFLRVAATSPVCKVADIGTNAKLVLEEIKKAETLGVNILLFPQLVITSASAGGLFAQSFFLDQALKAVLQIATETRGFKIIAVVGFPLFLKGKLYSAQAIIHNGEVCAIAPVTLPKEINSLFNPVIKSSFSYLDYSDIPVISNCIFHICSKTNLYSFVATSSVNPFCKANTDIMLIPMATPSFAFSSHNIKNLGCNLSKQRKTCVAFANCGIGESSGDFVFAGETGIYEAGKELCFSSALNSFKEKNSELNSNYCFSICDIDTELLKNLKIEDNRLEPNETPDGKTCSSNSFDFDIKITSSEKTIIKNTLYRNVEQNPFFPECDLKRKPFVYAKYCSEIINLQTIALAKRLKHINCTKCVLGISGGSDSTLALLTAVKCFDFLNIPHKNMYAINMSGFGTTSKTKNNAVELAKLLDCTVLEIPINNAVKQHFSDIQHDPTVYDTTFENAQARERTQILMDKANQIGGIMLGTGDLSESALGWTTYNGDHISMYELNASIPKTLLKECIKTFSKEEIFFKTKAIPEKAEQFKKILDDIIATPISPELLPPTDGKIMQKTENIIGAYELHDFFLYHTIKNAFSPKKIFFLASIAFNQKYSNNEILNVLQIFYKRLFSQQFKRSCSADGASVTGFSLSPRTSWIMSSDSCVNLWIKELDDLSKIV